MMVLEAIRALLAHEGVTYREVEHEPTRTSEASALARGEALRLGGKALVLKMGPHSAVFVLSAACKLDSAAIRAHFGMRKLRFLTAPELHELTGLVPGAVPPFGRPILPCDLYVDPSIPANPRIAFNAGSLTHSIILAMEDYLRLARPTVFRFAMP
ncbi:MAG: YbaK/EbsC family protein [Candidatus Tectimicrobiota bacterium]